MLTSKCLTAVRLRTALFRRVAGFSYSTKSNAHEKGANEEVSNSKDDGNQEKIAAEEIKKLSTTVDELKEKYQRSIAENENVRRRLRKEIADAKLYGIQGFCKDLLDVADVMKMAIKSIPDEKLTQETDQTWKSFFEGVSLTDKELHSVFERHGLVVLEPKEGDKFDPYDHEALFEAPSSELPPGSIAYIQRVGYKLQGRTIRPAQVGVTPKH